ncbi:MAG: type II toxin-antitoxin system HicA family toxin [Dehalogenimonas sp.]|uniref:Type II toxin-antitoxin system HicA family toxin n=1 Tax=Candidatus Dehalogenimonas loeffleri TaxID=3127115 RepID=A0ABZ2J1D1_9CHLR|nr:type II toxin-antitoxin system HicA family toxin [Dehalogenimonas sp.]
MRLPRDTSGAELADLLKTFGYAITRQSGSHLRLTSNHTGQEHHVTIPLHKPLRIGTLNALLTEVASYLSMDKEELALVLLK